MQADGSPHENCAAWKKDCPCTCAEGQSAPPQRQVDFFNDHSASGFGPDHNAADRAALKQAVAAATSTEAQVYVGEVVIRSEGGDDAPWQEIPIPEAGGDPSLDPQLRVNAKYPGDVETEEERALRVRMTVGLIGFCGLRWQFRSCTRTGVIARKHAVADTFQ